MNKVIYKSGEITVFLSLVFLALIGFVYVITKSAQDICIRQKIETITDISVRSAFSEYSKQFFDEYGLLYVDTTYKGVEEGGNDSFKNHVSTYIDANLEAEENDIYGLSLVYVEIESELYADEILSLEEINNDEGYCEFDLSKMLREALVTVVFENQNGKSYQCGRFYSLGK